MASLIGGGADDQAAIEHIGDVLQNGDVTVSNVDELYAALSDVGLMMIDPATLESLRADAVECLNMSFGEPPEE